MLCQYTSKFGKLSSGHRAGKGQISFQSPKKAMPRNVHTTTQLHSSHMLALVLQVISDKFGTGGNCQNIRVHLGQDFNLGILNNDYWKWFLVFYAVQTTGTIFKLTKLQLGGQTKKALVGRGLCFTFVANVLFHTVLSVTIEIKSSRL